MKALVPTASRTNLTAKKVVRHLARKPIVTPPSPFTPVETASKATPARSSSLDRVQAMVKVTGDLHATSGNLSASAIATTFGVSLNQLAKWLGRTRQALHKTPDADSLQPELVFFERVARLRSVVSSESFLHWLRMPNPELDQQRPLDFLATGERQVVADLVDDMLTGAPA